ncbi:hypothetical protein FOMPIDRAFT_1056322 [Fomitopsis schrenkii]|uniref:Uncharacterized protein n=1 Tax=Fomitopsis schrenkii TaxID=2126942 RepID=S8ETL0_FOMSC|nr:hypothetical protein FOMPIDRAFT_1056322 [Fomitopsis schrenkii]
MPGIASAKHTTIPGSIRLKPSPPPEHNRQEARTGDPSFKKTKEKHDKGGESGHEVGTSLYCWWSEGQASSRAIYCNIVNGNRAQSIDKSPRSSTRTRSRSANGTRLLNRRVYGARRNENPFATARSEEPEFVEWGYGGMGSVQSSGLGDKKWARALSGGVSIGAHEQPSGSSRPRSPDDDDDDGSGMAWVTEESSLAAKPNASGSDPAPPAEPEEVAENRTLSAWPSQVDVPLPRVAGTPTKEEHIQAVMLPPIHHHHHRGHSLSTLERLSSVGKEAEMTSVAAVAVYEDAAAPHRERELETQHRSSSSSSFSSGSGDADADADEAPKFKSLRPPPSWHYPIPSEHTPAPPDFVPFPNTAHVKAAEEHIATLERRWVERCVAELGHVPDKDAVHTYIPLRPPPSASNIVHLPFPSSPTNTPGPLNALIPFVNFLESLLQPPPEMTLAQARALVNPPLIETFPSSSSGHRRASTSGFQPSSLPPPSSFPASFLPPWPFPSAYTRTHSTSATFLPPLPPSSNASSSPAVSVSATSVTTTNTNTALPASFHTRPVKILIFSADGYTESSMLARSTIRVMSTHAQLVSGKGLHGQVFHGQGSLWIEEREGRIKVLDVKGVCDDGIDTLEPQLGPI